ncbi:MAG: pantoate--beta-alanine ligase [Beijerinckiaceae bacterium]|nr:pantoate--beta-alanine ligase [Beijerinckiaceae bacterium]
MSLSIKSGLVHTRADLRTTIAAWRAKGERIALVPTMGALHAGHMALVSEARRHADRVVATIFVNPTQFAPTEDFSAYPRTLEDDRRRVDEAGGDLVYAPEASAIYPDGFATSVNVAGPALADLEDRFRPTHFAGVATIVAKLLIQALPDVALFGDKDFQQLCVIKRLARDLDLPVEIRGVPIVRDADGLALSSRNVYLSPSERAVAPALHAALRDAASAIRRGGAPGPSLDAARAAVTGAGFVIDYIEARDSESLAPLADGATAGRILAAARLGRTRLIDNVAIEDEV